MRDNYLELRVETVLKGLSFHTMQQIKAEQAGIEKELNKQIDKYLQSNKFEESIKREIEVECERWIRGIVNRVMANRRTEIEDTVEKQVLEQIRI